MAVKKPSDVPAGIDGLFRRVVMILEEARSAVVRSVNSQMVLAYWHIGREIVQSLQGGGERAEYGTAMLAVLSEHLGQRYGKGFSVTNLRYFRLFYQAYADRKPEIHHKPCDESIALAAQGKRHKLCDDLTESRAAEQAEGGRGFSDRLSWSHYRTLSRIENEAERHFYEIEAEREGWSIPHLERQIHTMLFTRLLKSRDKAGVLELAREGHAIRKPTDALKDPYILDFLDLPDGGLLRESDLEAAIIEQLQAFLLELGKGFAFVARQRRLSYGDEHFYVDLVFYHTILKCYLLIDLKIGKLTHQDIGQMDSYVRLFDDQNTTEGDSPTIGLILCAEKNEAIARYSVLNEGRQIFAAKYVKHLPTEAELQHEIERQRRIIEARSSVSEKESV